MENIFTPVLANGVPSNVIYYLLLIPFIVMLATFARHVIGIKIFSMFISVGMTLIIGFLIRSDSYLSLVMGTIIFTFIYFFSYFIKKLTNSFSLHYFARISFVVTMISILLLGVLTVAGRFPEFVRILQLDTIAPFAIAFAVLLSEYFSSNQSQKGFRTSRLLFLNSTIFAVLIGALIAWNGFETFLFRYPFFIFVCMAATFMIGKYTGLRVTEMQRFRDVESD